MTQVGSPAWLVVGWVFASIGVLSAPAILADILRGYRRHMGIMNWVWPITALYWVRSLSTSTSVAVAGCPAAGRVSTALPWSR